MTDAIPTSLHGCGTILRRQTTFWDITNDETLNTWRVHFRHKVESHFSQARFDHPAVESRHPLLIDHHESRDPLFVSSPAEDPGAILRELEAVSHQFFEGWRPLAGYLNPGYPAAKLLSEGSGMLLDGPSSFITACRRVLANYGVRIDALKPGVPPSAKFQALMLGSNYVIAERFAFDPLYV